MIHINIITICRHTFSSCICWRKFEISLHLCMLLLCVVICRCILSVFH